MRASLRIVKIKVIPHIASVQQLCDQFDNQHRIVVFQIEIWTVIITLVIVTRIDADRAAESNAIPQMRLIVDQITNQ